MSGKRKKNSDGKKEANNSKSSSSSNNGTTANNSSSKPSNNLPTAPAPTSSNKTAPISISIPQTNPTGSNSISSISSSPLKYESDEGLGWDDDFPPSLTDQISSLQERANEVIFHSIFFSKLKE